MDEFETASNGKIDTSALMEECQRVENSFNELSENGVFVTACDKDGKPIHECRVFVDGGVSSVIRKIAVEKIKDCRRALQAMNGGKGTVK